MAPNKRQFAYPPKKSNEQQLRETEHDHLEAADEFESSGSKWKAGDSAKALRFYQKAISAYDEGLKKYPKSFDLAYNKALLLYNITQDSWLSSQVGPLLDLLKQALDAHRDALRIDAENADLLFNTAQVLTSLAEELNENADHDEGEKRSAVKMLQEAVELFNACLLRQEREFEEMQELMKKAAEGDSMYGEPTAEKASGSSDTADDAQGSEWATVKEPVTPRTLIDTALAQLASLSSLATIAAPTTAGFLENICNIVKPVILTKLPAYISLLPTSAPQEPDQTEDTPYLSISATSSSFVAQIDQGNENPQFAANAEANLANAVFLTAIAGSKYLSSLSATSEYHRQVTQAFQGLSQKGTSYPDTLLTPLLSAYADALVDFADNVAEMAKSHSNDDDNANAQTYRWTALEEAQKHLSQVVSRLPNPSVPTSKAQVYYTRANIELLRRQLTLLPSASKTLRQNEGTLTKNAGVYYRGATALAKQEGDEELTKDAEFRGHVVKILEEKYSAESSGTSRDWLTGMGEKLVVEGLEEMIQDALVDEAEVRHLLSAS